MLCINRSSPSLKKDFLFLMSFLLLNSYGALAATSTMGQTKAKLQQLELKIHHLQSTLHNAQDRHIVLIQELAAIEKKINIGTSQLRITEREVASKQLKVDELQQQVNQLNTKLQNQQHLLAKHLRARYTMGEYQPLKILLNQDNPFTTSRLLTFYQYIIKSRQQMITDIQLTKKNLTTSQDKLHRELEEHQHLQQQLNQNQRKLEQDKLYRVAIIKSLNADIYTKQQTLVDYQQNKNNLTNLLNTLTQQSILQNQRPFISMRKKLPRPLAVNRNNLKTMNQGVVFFAKEGAPVTAVFPGKIVFSDWLNGYGLLLIIDHGRGFMTLYAHNQSLFKHKGDVVNQGTEIAAVGHSGGIKENGLYFEIRKRGKAIPPLEWLS